MDTDKIVSDTLDKMGFAEHQKRFSSILFMSGVLLTEGIIYSDQDKIDTGITFAVYAKGAGEFGSDNNTVFDMLMHTSLAHQCMCGKQLSFDEFTSQILKSQSEIGKYIANESGRICHKLQDMATEIDEREGICNDNNTHDC